ncbi:hypothetical protein J6590_019963 [Homalodisca vitripennis]|nr:hypothetical protein J6590_019963 [Homalodisca vitripennis]
MSRVYGENFMSDGVRCKKFKDGRVDFLDKGGKEHKSVPKVDLVEQIDKTVARKSECPIYCTVKVDVWYNAGLQKLTLRVVKDAAASIKCRSRVAKTL